jgi:3-phenylpropionate/cinnamic acid dioxygenase small subunit
MPDMTRADAEAFLYREARLIDERRFDDWLELFTDDAVYWLPIDEHQGPKEHLSLIYDDAHRLKERVYRLSKTVFPAQNPPSRTQHFVSNVEVERGANAEIVVRSGQIIYELRSGDDRQYEIGDQRTIAARCEHRLRGGADGWRIAMKRMVLLNRDLAIPNLTFLL